MDNPKETRMIQTRDGIARIPRSQTGMPLRDYFRNAELPENLNRANVFITENGPVLTDPDPVPWNEEHDKQAQYYADKLKEQIDDKGYYSRTLGNYADRLSEVTGYSEQEMRTHIAAKFEATHGQLPQDYLEQVRIQKGLPVRDRQSEPQQVHVQDI